MDSRSVVCGAYNLDSAMQQNNAANTYPPYNIEQTGENDYSVTLALAGFGEEDVEITTKENTLVVAGKLVREDDNDISYLYRGIAGRAFERVKVVATESKAKRLEGNMTEARDDI